MDISGIGSGSAAQSVCSNVSVPESPEQAFLDFMKESPAERMEDMWLASHHLTKQDLAAMSPEKREAIEKQMAHDIKQEIEQKMKQQASSLTDSILS
ncbi:MAG: hypothetical protein P4M13_08050 [Alphaproteobacteria bacterium]|nr:hypothetical protein [Alphaproteobacteria bacterium]